MKKKVFVVCLLLAFTVVQAIAQVKNTGIIPAPASVDWGTGVLNVPSKISFSTNLSGQDLTDITEWMKRMSGSISPFKFEQTKSDRKAFLVLNTIKGAPAESYSLKVTEKSIIVEAADKAGVLYALQSLCQMANHFSMNIPVVTIADQPRFEYRGIMLDPARYFIKLETLKRQLDMMAHYKLNKFHIHLTDDCAWRIEIKKHPELTQKAAYNQYQCMWDWECGKKNFCEKDAPGAVGGYYTQDEMRELVEYARKLNITVIPEVDFPGHSDAVMRVYPEYGLSCQGSNANIYCAGNEKTFEFLQDVFTEIIDIFPSKLIHVGGDEVTKSIWAQCSKCQERMRKEGIKDVNELQSYMVKRMDKFLISKGRNLVGWDEILHGGLADGATVMSWTGVAGGIEAAKQGKNAIMTPEPYCYIDGFQDHPTNDMEISSGWYLPIERVYSYNPVPESLSPDVAKKIIGVQANLWGLWIESDSELEFMLWPRAMAIAENGWSPNENKSYPQFYANVLESIENMQKLGYTPFNLKNAVGDRPTYQNKFTVLSTGKKVILPNSGDEIERAKLLTDGQGGSWRLSDQSWLLDNVSKDYVVDLGENQPINSISVSFIQTRGHRIPQSVEYYISDDNQNFTLVNKFENTVQWTLYMDYVSVYKDIVWEGATKGRYVRVKVDTDKHWGADEIIVR